MSQGHEEQEIEWLLGQARSRGCTSSSERPATGAISTRADKRSRSCGGALRTSPLAPPPDRKEPMNIPAKTLESNGGGT